MPEFKPRHPEPPPVGRQARRATDCPQRFAGWSNCGPAPVQLSGLLQFCAGRGSLAPLQPHAVNVPTEIIATMKLAAYPAEGELTPVHVQLWRSY